MTVELVTGVIRWLAILALFASIASEMVRYRGPM